MEVLGIDIGGSGVKGAPVNIKTGELTGERHRLSTPQPATPQAVAETLLSLVTHFDWAGSIGCGFPAVVQNGIARTAANIDKSWIDTNVEILFSEATGCPTRVLNDADAAGLAEMEFGAGKNSKGTVIMITVGTGLGTAIFTDGHLLPNSEFGHIMLNGKIAEHYASDIIRKQEDLSWEKWAERFDNYLHNIEALFWPNLIIIGGGVSKEKKWRKFSQNLTLRTEVVQAQLKNHAGIIGAALRLCIL